jgi:squalene-hopene/tetraprenyl-beta-curcumene cyclase
MKACLPFTEAFLAFMVLACIWGCSRAPAKTSTSLNLNHAATYLDTREAWWMQWVGSSRDQGTFCVSCHTALPYALARPALRAAVGEPTPGPYERALLDNVIKRVRLWKETKPYYSEDGYDQKTPESRGTESVLNAVVLANYDSQNEKVSEDTRVAFQNMWALQKTTGELKGSWDWLQFDEEPWEAKDSVYYGACLAAVATGIAPEHYSASPEIQENLTMLRSYLRDNAASQSTINRVYVLWASTKLPDLLTQDEQQAIIREVLSRQQTDGGWRLAAITWSWKGWSGKTLFRMWLREDGTPLYGKSDGVATGLLVYVLRQAGVPADNQQLQKGISWLRTHQTSEGDWPASSVNKLRHMSAYTRLFMNDAATAFAVLALEEPQRKPVPMNSASNRSPQR